MLFPRRMPSFFESFPVILVDTSGTVRAESKYALERLGIVVSFDGSALDGVKITNQYEVAQSQRVS